ncbi:hypothetical protein LCGC14_1718160 [marine sediment metagenome]|uniref:Uncharacterized protein n=1 Tax=marine sediment metagenome TaxID=412755 RepID=A0A0F9KD31_9ZZZZ
MKGSAVTERLLRLTAFVSAAAFLLSATLHVASLWGHIVDSFPVVAALYYGMLPIAVPSVWANHRLVRGYRKNEYRRAILRGCPGWMKKLVYLLGIYTIVGFFLFSLLHLFGSHSRGVDPADVWSMRLASLLWMIFYATAGAVLYSGAKVYGSDNE